MLEGKQEVSLFTCKKKQLKMYLPVVCSSLKMRDDAFWFMKISTYANRITVFTLRTFNLRRHS